MRQSAIVLVFDETGQVLSLRRGPTDPWMPGRWNFPGGHVNPREPIEHAARREVAEEAGFSLGRVTPAFSYRHPQGVIHVFVARVETRPRVTLPDGEHDRYAWTSLDAVPTPTVPHLPLVVARVSRLWHSKVNPDLDSVAGGEQSDGEVRYMHFTSSPPWPARYPGYLPYPHAIKRSRQPVPNESAIHWPQAQFAPEWLPPGSPPFQPYRYPDGPLMRRADFHTDNHAGDLRPFTPEQYDNWLHIQDPKALVEDTLQKIGASSWIEDRTGRMMQIIEPACGCGPSYDCGCGGSSAKANPITDYFKNEDGSVSWGTVLAATAVAVGVGMFLMTPRDEQLDASKARATALTGW